MIGKLRCKGEKEKEFETTILSLSFLDQVLLKLIEKYLTGEKGRMMMMMK